MEGTYTYAIYGANRTAKDILYLFKEFRPACVMDDGAWEREWNGFSVLSLEEGLLRRDFDRILACGFDKEETAGPLRERGLKEGEDWIWVGDWIDQKDAGTDLFQGRELVLWGAGKKGEQFMEWNRSRGYKISRVIDRRAEKGTFHGIPVERPEQFEGWENAFVIIAVAKDLEIRGFLEERLGGGRPGQGGWQNGGGGQKRGGLSALRSFGTIGEAS